MAYLHRPDSESGARRVSYRGRCWEEIDEHGSCETVRANSISENAHSRFRLTRNRQVDTATSRVMISVATPECGPVSARATTGVGSISSQFYTPRPFAVEIGECA